MSYGVQRPNEFDDVNSPLYRQWFQKLYSFLYSTIKLVTVTTTYTVTGDVFYVRADASGGSFTITLPPALGEAGRQIVIKRISSGAGTVTIDTTGSDTIDGASSVTLSSQYDVDHFISNGNNGWELI